MPHERLGTLENGFKAAGCGVAPFHGYEAKAAWPSPGRYDGIVVMGGPQGVSRQDQSPYLTGELGFLQEAAKGPIPMLGVCLGAQLLVEALGGTVRQAPQQELGWPRSCASRAPTATR